MANSRTEISRIVAASGNRHKLRELSTVGERFGLAIISPAEVATELGLAPLGEVEESGSTFAENAALKAEACCRWCGLPSLGDDSGLEVFALDMAPGIYSARYAGPGASDEDRIRKLLLELDSAEKRGVADRRAQFRCVLVLALPDGSSIRSEAILPGEILREPRGAGGFGYDPIVYHPELNATLAEVDFTVTCSKGFRARAAEKLFDQLVSHK